MKEFVREVMRVCPTVVAPETMVLEVARRMRDDDIGDVIVSHGRQLRGILTDRDIVVRSVAAGTDPATTPVSEICSEIVHTTAPDQELATVLNLMRTHAIRRIPVVDHGEVVGVLTLGDLAMALNGDSVLAEISAANPNT
jgi:CBS domain-containing protein